MTKKIWVVLLIFFSMILFNATAHPKCALVRWQIVGRVISESTKAPIEGAKVFVFLDDSESTDSNGYYTKYPDFFLTQADGMFHAASYIDSFKRRSIFGIGPDICSRKPKYIELFVIKEGSLTLRKRFNKSQYEMQQTDEIRRIILPDILLGEPMNR